MFVGSYCAPSGAIVYCQPAPTIEGAHAVALSGFEMACHLADVAVPTLHPATGGTLPCYARPDGTAACVQVEPGPLARLSSYDTEAGIGRIIELA
jgi:hypothetical protein